MPNELNEKYVRDAQKRYDINVSNTSTVANIITITIF